MQKHITIIQATTDWIRLYTQGVPLKYAFNMAFVTRACRNRAYKLGYTEKEVNLAIQQMNQHFEKEMQE